MASVRGWAKRVDLALARNVVIETGIMYAPLTARLISLTLLATQVGDPGQSLELEFTPDEARLLGDHIVNFLSRLEE